MALTFYVGENGTTLLSAAKKINQLMIDKKSESNPYAKYRAVPDTAEARKTGGGIYTWYLTLGQDRAGRRGSAPTETNTKLDNSKNKNATKELLVSQPLQYPKEDNTVIPLAAHDILELDGVDTSPSTNAGVVKSLVVAEIETDRTAITNVVPTAAGVVADKARKFISTGTTPLAIVEDLMEVASDYEDISVNNSRWGIETQAGGEENYNADFPATKYFHQNTYAYDKGEVDIHMHPNDITKLSLVNTQAGAGSEAQFMQFKNGSLTHINGQPVITNRWVKPGNVEFWAVKTIGTPDEEIMETNIFQDGIKFHKISGIRAEHYYDSVILHPELLTIVDITSLTRKTISQIKSDVEAKTATLDSNIDERISALEAKYQDQVKALEAKISEYENLINEADEAVVEEENTKA